MSSTIRNGAAPTSSPAGQVDYDLHGLVGIRLVDAGESDVAAVSRQLGPVRGELSREPDLLIRFVDRLPRQSRLRYLGLDEAAFSDEGFLVLRGKHKSRVMVRIPMAEIGQRCEIVCERGLAAVPLLVPIVNLTALTKGFVPVHASAFEYRGSGVLATGWSKGGKTETLLAFMAEGARYLGDEWVYLGGGRLHGIPEPVRVWDWHLKELPRYRAALTPGERARLKAIGLLDAVNRTTGELARRGGLPGRSLPARLQPLIRRQLCVDVPPERLFAQPALARSAPLDLVLFVVSHESAEVVVEPIDPLEIAARTAASLEHERLPFLAYYHMFRFAFPGCVNERIEQAGRRERELLEHALAGKRAYAVCHPYPVRLRELFSAIRPLVAPQGAATP